MKKIRILLVDDHEVIRQGLKSLLEGYEDIVVVAEASNGNDAIAMALEHKPDVTLMDISMPEMDGIEATRILKQQCPDCEVLALTVHEDSQFLFEMLEAGASGYVTKRSLTDDVIKAIKAVARKEAFLPPEYTRLLIEYFRSLISEATVSKFVDEDEKDDSMDVGILSKRELQVLRLVAEGYRSAKIGELLGITTHTVSRHRARIMDKLDLNSAAELVRFAIKKGLVKP